jgi:hypothetical protein
MATSVPHARAPAGLTLHSDNPADFAAALDAFLAEVLSKS